MTLYAWTQFGVVFMQFILVLLAVRPFIRIIKVDIRRGDMVKFSLGIASAMAVNTFVFRSSATIFVPGDENSIVASSLRIVATGFLAYIVSRESKW